MGTGGRAPGGAFSYEFSLTALPAGFADASDFGYGLGCGL